MAGRKPKPTKLKLIKGTARKCRLNPKEPRAPENVPRAAVDLDSRSSFWYGIAVSRVQGLGIASVVDSERIMLLAMDLANLELHDTDIKEYGRVYVKVELLELPDGTTKAQKILKANPAVGQRDACVRRINGMLSEFGLSPASRSKVTKSDDGEKEKNPFEIFG